jgi:hypothetical protein
MNLDKEDVLLLIQEYQKNRVLWDSRDKWHFNKIKKKRCLGRNWEIVKIDKEGEKKKFQAY